LPGGCAFRPEWRAHEALRKDAAAYDRRKAAFFFKNRVTNQNVTVFVRMVGPKPLLTDFFMVLGPGTAILTGLPARIADVRQKLPGKFSRRKIPTRQKMR
jgi:hypothetical protein